MRLNEAYLSRSRSPEVKKRAMESLRDGEDVEKRSEDELVSDIIEGMQSSDEEERTEDLSLDLSGLTKSEKERSAERRRHEREELAEQIAEKMAEKGAFSSDERVSKGEETPDGVESCQRTLDLLDELIEQTE